MLAEIHPEVSARYYGCGLVAPDALEGLRILDLGCGAGRDVYLLLRLVGADGEVVGVDMTREQLAVAERHRDYHATRYGHARSNVRFIAGRIEALGELGLEPGGFDLIVSNCVINLSPDKPAVLEQAHALLKVGGEFYFSDVYADRRVPSELQSDPVLYGECLAGALYWNDFLRLARRVGFADPRLVEDRPLCVTDPGIAERLGPIRAFSATYRLFKLPGLESEGEDYGETATYLGTLPGHPERWRLDKHHVFPTGQAVAISRNTCLMVRDSRFATHFKIGHSDGRHRGLFTEPERGFPFATTASAVALPPIVAGCCG